MMVRWRTVDFEDAFGACGLVQNVDILRHDAADHAFFLEFGENCVDDARLEPIQAIAEFARPCIKYGRILAEKRNRQNIFDGIALPGFGINAVFAAKILDSRERRCTGSRKNRRIFL